MAALSVPVSLTSVVSCSSVRPRGIGNSLTLGCSAADRSATPTVAELEVLGRVETDVEFEELPQPARAIASTTKQKTLRAERLLVKTSENVLPDHTVADATRRSGTRPA